MKKIMFNDKYGLTAAVLNGDKTMTRRIMPDNTPLGKWEDTVKKSRYQVGEFVAVAQAYKHIVDNHYFQEQCLANETDAVLTRFDAGWDNKMFVKSYYMPHRIRITDIKVERLKDISEADCLREGIIDKITPVLYPCGNHVYTFEGNNGGSWYGSIQGYITAKTAFAALIDKVSGSGTWERNPWVFAYTFELERRAR